MAQLASALNLLGLILAASGDYAGARARYEESLAARRAVGDQRWVGVSLCNLGELARRMGDFDTAARCLAEAVELLRDAGDAVTVAFCLADLGEVRIWQGRPDEARPLVLEGLALSKELGERFVEAMGLHNLGRLAGLAGDQAEELRQCAAALERRHSIGDKEGMAKSLEAFTALALDRAPAFAARLLGSAEALRERTGRPVAPVYGRFSRRPAAGCTLNSTTRPRRPA